VVIRFSDVLGNEGLPAYAHSTPFAGA